MSNLSSLKESINITFIENGPEVFESINHG